MAASTAHTNTKTYLSPNALCCNKKETTMATTLREKDSLYNAIYDLVRCIPAGRVTNYGAIAKAIGTASGARVVGYAMNLCHGITPPVPAHRVVNRMGMLTGKHHFATPTLMQELLELEGIKIENDIILNFDKVFWDPTKELDM